MRAPDTAHTSRPWRVHELTSDFPARGCAGAADTDFLHRIARIAEGSA